MIDNYKALSRRYLKQNKKRTLLTLIGIILSLSLVATIGLFVKSAEKSQIENAKHTEGFSFHLGYKTYTEDILSKVANNPNVQRYGIMERGDTVTYNDIYIDRYYMDKGATELLNYSVKEGRMPQNDSEISIDQWSKNYIKENLNLGDKIVIKGKTYTVVGFLKNDEYFQRTKSCRAIVFSNAPKNGQLMVEISPKADFSETLKNISNLTTNDNLILNQSLIRLNEMNSNKTLIIIACIAIVIVVSATIIVIHNSFQINVAERLKQFGLLRSIGATKKQIKKIVFREATIFLIIAIPIGISISIGAIYGLNFIFKLILKGDAYFSLVSIDVGILIISIIITILAVYISSLIPANFVGSISPLAAISSRVIIKKEAIKRRKYPLLKKIFNYKVVMAVKNIRRNPSRCRTMILSIIVSSALFITFTSSMNEIFTIKNPNGAYETIDLEVNRSSDNDDSVGNNNQIVDDLASQLSTLNNVNKVYIQYTDVFGMAEVPLNKRIKEAGGILQKQKFEDGYKEVIVTKIKNYDKAALEDFSKYLLSGNIDVNRMNSENGVILVDNGKVRDYNTGKLYIGKLTDYKVNDEITVLKDSKETKVKIMAIIKEDIFEREDSTNVLTLITGDQVLKNITGEAPKIRNLSIALKDKALNLKTAEEVNNILKDYPSYTVINYADINKSQKDSMLMIKVLIYGFIAVITLISSINIINTITMNITLRRKESAMLKSIGMSQKDLKKIIRYEGIFYGIIGSTLGAIVGCFLSYSIFNVLSDVVIVQWKLPLGLIAITILVAIGISYLSTLIPMKKIEKDNVIEAIREE
ncbi:ABC transporter permease [Clostridium sp. Marseille-QA1073]